MSHAVAAPPMTVDGIAPARIVEPERPEDVAEILAEADAHGSAVTPFGGATSLGLGNLPDRLDLGLSTAKLRGVIDYEPTDLTLSVAAGSRLADVQAVLAEHGQTLPIEVPLTERATIGGLIATALAGPRRYGAGSLRDLLIGISAAHPSGTVTKAGGLVVKNVTGFDLMRLYVGSLGTLGVIVSANFKVVPLPRFEATVIATYGELPAAFRAAQRLRLSRVQPVALEIARAEEREWRLASRIEGREATIRLLASEAKAILESDATMLEARESADWWRSYVADQAIAAGAGEALVRSGVQPSASEVMVTALLGACTEDISLNHLMISPGLGSLVARVGVADAPAFHRFLDALSEASQHVVVLAADPELKRDIDVWGRAPETIDVMRAIKHQFDPNRVLNPGRFAGRL